MHQETSTYNNDTALLGIGSPGIVTGEGQLLETVGILVTDDASSLVWRDVDVLVSEFCLGGGCVDGLGEALATLQPGWLWQAVDGLGFLVPVPVSGCRIELLETCYSLVPGASGDISAHCSRGVSLREQES